MGKKRLRPVDLAREHGLSAQAVRTYEEQGIVPTAERTRHGYRVYTPLHARALLSSRRTGTRPRHISCVP